MTALLLLLVSAAPAPFTWPTPDLLEQIDVPGFVRAQGVPMKLRAVRLRHRMPELIGLYVDAFQKARFYIPPPKDQVEWFREPALTALDPTRLVSYTVLFQENRDGTTTLVLGEANLALERAAEPGEAPVMPGATQLVRTAFEGGWTLGYRTRATPAQVRDFYADALGRAGWEVADVDGVARFRWKRRELELRVSAERAGSRVLLLTHDGP